MIQNAEYTPVKANNLAHLVGGSETIFGSPVDLDLKWSYDGNAETVSVSLTLHGHSIGSATLSAADP